MLSALLLERERRSRLPLDRHYDQRAKVKFVFVLQHSRAQALGRNARAYFADVLRFLFVKTRTAESDVRVNF
jgi:hypothetical protein